MAYRMYSSISLASDWYFFEDSGWLSLRKEARFLAWFNSVIWWSALLKMKCL